MEDRGVFPTTPLKGKAGERLSFGIQPGRGEALIDQPGECTFDRNAVPCDMNPDTLSVDCTVPEGPAPAAETIDVPLTIGAKGSTHVQRFQYSYEPDENAREPSSQSPVLRLLGPVLSRLPPLGRECLGEFLGTMLLVYVIVAVVAAAVFQGAQSGIWQVAVVIGLGVATAIYCYNSICPAHFNPAVTITMAVFRPRDFSARKVLPYCLSQLAGGYAAALLNYSFWSGYIAQAEEAAGVTRGECESVFTAQAFGEYFPNPGFQPTYCDMVESGGFPLSVWQAFLVEVVGTALLLFVILAVTDGRNRGVIPKFAPLLIGGIVAIYVSLCAPLTQVGLNPARDFGPRLAAVSLGWKTVAIPGPRYGFWIYILGPVVGGLAGATLYDICLPLEILSPV